MTQRETLTEEARRKGITIATLKFQRKQVARNKKIDAARVALQRNPTGWVVSGKKGH
jgi:hypothetical protein